MKRIVNDKTHHTTNRPVVISTQPQRAVEGQKARDDRVRDNLPANAVVTAPSASSTRPQARTPSRHGTQHRPAACPRPESADERPVPLFSSLRHRVRDGRNRRFHNPASNALFLTSPRSGSSPCPDHPRPRERVNATEIGDPRRGVCGSRVRDVSPSSAASVGLPEVPGNGFVK